MRTGQRKRDWANVEAVFPVPGPLLAIHNGDNPDPIGLVDINYRVREYGREVATCRMIKNSKQFGLLADSFDQSINLFEESSA